MQIAPGIRNTPDTQHRTGVPCYSSVTTASAGTRIHNKCLMPRAKGGAKARLPVGTCRPFVAAPVDKRWAWTHTSDCAHSQLMHKWLLSPWRGCGKVLKQAACERAFNASFQQWPKYMVADDALLLPSPFTCTSYEGSCKLSSTKP